jgi:hypothetical protein
MLAMIRERQASGASPTPPGDDAIPRTTPMTQMRCAFGENLSIEFPALGWHRIVLASSDY